MSKKDIAGLTFHRLTALRFIGKNNHGNYLWECRCECGNEIVAQSSKLIHGHTKSCGCIRGDTLRENLVGKRYGRLTVIGLNRERKSSSVFWDCRCDCGTTKAVSRAHLLSGATISCGCYHKERSSEVSTTHGLSGHPLYNIWSAMLQRCTNKNAAEFHNYGGIGISVCRAWSESFQAFYDWAIQSGYQRGLSIDRYPNRAGNYEPNNCRWATPTEQSRNKRNTKLSDRDVSLIRCDSRSHVVIAKEYGISPSYVSNIKAGRYWK